MAGRATLLAHSDEIYAHGKKRQANEASGQESLWGDEEEAHPSFEPEIFARFEQLCKANFHLLRDPPKPPPRVEHDDPSFWEYQRRMARAGK